MWDKLVAALAALIKALEPYMPAIAAYFAGKGSERHAQAENAVKAVGKAAEAGSRSGRMSRDEQLRWLWERDLLRGVPADDSKRK
jgi:hypothetical protein